MDAVKPVFLDGFVKRPIPPVGTKVPSMGNKYRRYASSLLTAAYEKYAACGTRDSGIPRDSQALISNVLRIRLKRYFLRVPQSLTAR